MKTTITLLLSCCAFFLTAQDAHFSLFQDIGMYYNPAFTGKQIGTTRIGVQYRSQWATIPTAAYTTPAVYLERGGERFGWGGLIYQNKAGEASLKTTAVQFKAAYHKDLGDDNTLSLGVGLGSLQKRFDPSAFTFDSQYLAGTGYDATLDPDENFPSTSKSMLDVAVGVNWQSRLSGDQDMILELGGSVAHFHMPQENFYNEIAVIPTKYSLQATLDIAPERDFNIAPSLLYQKQGAHSTLVAAARAGLRLEGEKRLLLGLGYRFGDAFLLSAGLEMGDLQLGIAYDVNSSMLTQATSGRGAFELGLSYTIPHKKKTKGLRDTDRDGLPDHMDDCPRVPGTPEWAGCSEPQNEDGDADRDGVLDSQDNCPFVPGLVAFRGCPDSDKDGLPDPDDRCPYLPGKATNDGCPVQTNDADGDGIPDAEDFCVYIPGSAALRGCPDTDGDGISDIDDHCPYLKGVRAKQGCPGEAQAETEMTSVIVEFETDKSEVRPMYFRRLSQLANSLQAKRYRLVISGHTDAEGSMEYNYALSKRRATAVQYFLLGQGVPLERMQLYHYGEDIPKRENTDSGGRARNRRTEVMVFMEE